MRPLGIVVWGIGPHAIRNVVPAILRCPGLVLRGLCSRNAQLIQAAGLGCRYWDAPEGMLDDEEVDVVYLSTPIGLHAEHGERVLRAGKHLWCEKPLAHDLASVRSIVELSRARGRCVCEAFMYLHHPHFATLRALVDDGRIGAVRSIGCRFGVPPLERPGFRLDPQLGGGAFLDVGCYPVSAMAGLFPAVEPELLWSEIVQGKEEPVDSWGRAVLGYPCAVRASLEWGTCCAYRNEIDIWGSTGAIYSEKIFSKPSEHRAVIWLKDLHGSASRIEVAPANHFVSMLQAFAAAAAAPASAEAQRAAIVHRAAIMERIRVGT